MEEEKIIEDVPCNSMGTSSSTAGTGAIDIFDPVLKVQLKKNQKSKITSLLKRKLLSEK
jgi:hypothetical protein